MKLRRETESVMYPGRYATTARLHTLHSVIRWEQQFDVQKSPKHSKVIKKIQAEGMVSADHL